MDCHRARPAPYCRSNAARAGDAHAATSQAAVTISPARLLAWPSMQPRLDDAADQPRIALGVDRLQPRRLADQLAGLAARLGEQHRHRRARLGDIECPRLLAEQRLQRREPRILHRFGQLIAHCRTRRAGTAAVLERIGRRETDLLDQPHRVVEIGIALARKADDEVGRQSEIRPRRAQAIDEPEKKIAAVLAVHRLEDAVRARLHRQMQVRHELRHLAVHGDQLVVHVARMRGRVADARDALDLGQRADQARERPGRAILGSASP